MLTSGSGVEVILWSRNDFDLAGSAQSDSPRHRAPNATLARVCLIAANHQFVRAPLSSGFYDFWRRVAVFYLNLNGSAWQLLLQKLLVLPASGCNKFCTPAKYPLCFFALIIIEVVIINQVIRNYCQNFETGIGRPTLTYNCSNRFFARRSSINRYDDTHLDALNLE
jgi:hypothetical protein